MYKVNRGRKEYNTRYLNSPSSCKKYADRLTKCTTYVKADDSHKRVYQLDSQGKLIKIWDSKREIADLFKIPINIINDYVTEQKIVNDNFLFVMMFDYKTTIDYKILFKYLKHKEKNTVEPEIKSRSDKGKKRNPYKKRN